MILSLRGQLLIGAASLLIGLVVTFPARFAIDWFAPPDLAVSGIEGTAWSGSVSEASVAGIYLQDLRWDFAPFGLFTGALSWSVSARPASGFVETELNVGLGGSLLLENLNAALPMQLFAGVIGVPGMQGSGSLRFERIEIAGGLPVAADGQLQIADLYVPMAGRDSLGGYKIEFFTQDEGITASIEDSDGAVDLAGSLQLKPDRSYQLIAQVVATDKTPEGIRRQLRFLPPANERGQQELRLEGVL